MATEAVDSDFKVVDHKICHTKQLLDFFVGGREVNYFMTLIADSVVVRVWLVLKKRFTAEGNFFDVTFGHKLIEVAIHSGEIYVGESTVNSSC